MTVNFLEKLGKVEIQKIHDGIANMVGWSA